MMRPVLRATSGAAWLRPRAAARPKKFENCMFDGGSLLRIMEAWFEELWRGFQCVILDEHLTSLYQRARSDLTATWLAMKAVTAEAGDSCRSDHLHRTLIRGVVEVVRRSKVPACGVATGQKRRNTLRVSCTA